MLIIYFIHVIFDIYLLNAYLNIHFVIHILFIIILKLMIIIVIFQKVLMNFSDFCFVYIMNFLILFNNFTSIFNSIIKD